MDLSFLLFNELLTCFPFAHASQERLSLNDIISKSPMRLGDGGPSTSTHIGYLTYAMTRIIDKGDTS